MAMHESVTSNGLIKTSSVDIASLVNDAPSLVDNTGGTSTVASNVSLVEPGQQLAANTFQKIGIVCRVVSLIVNPNNVPLIVPTKAPMPIVQQQCAGQG